jgi:hypothetical protein
MTENLAFNSRQIAIILPTGGDIIFLNEQIDARLLSLIDRRRKLIVTSRAPRLHKAFSNLYGMARHNSSLVIKVADRVGWPLPSILCKNNNPVTAVVGHEKAAVARVIVESIRESGR